MAKSDLKEKCSSSKQYAKNLNDENYVRKIHYPQINKANFVIAQI